VRTKLNSILLRRILIVCLAAGLFYAATSHAQDNDVVVRDAWVRVPAPSKMETALYMVIENHGSQKRALVSASSDLAGKIELHQMRMDGRVMIMTPVARIDLPAGGKATLSPSGFHMMMFRLTTRPTVGDNVKVIIKLDDGTSIPVTATVKK
jgi:copper(I)-binding protein